VFFRVPGEIIRRAAANGTGKKAVSEENVFSYAGARVSWLVSNSKGDRWCRLCLETSSSFWVDEAVSTKKTHQF
jgi:hypothetical protein